MLSPETVNLLTSLRAASSAVYPEGGLLHTYTEAENQAHSLLPTTGGRRTQPTLDCGAVADLARFLEVSQGNPSVIRPSARFVEIAEHLVMCLRKDLEYDDVCCHLSTEDYGMTIEIQMAKIAENRYFSLKLLWSVD